MDSAEIVYNYYRNNFSHKELAEMLLEKMSEKEIDDLAKEVTEDE